ncbi:MAG: helix-turn-helix transcriptional regulator [Deltaproteobacteria bacterium]|nr:helix-turn-helix transcriptional regulator [Deltaproteobacteria bacterium]
MKHRKFKKAIFDNKKKVFYLEYSSGLKLECPYSALSVENKIVDSGPDEETGHHSFYFVTDQGKKEFVPFDQPLHIAQHPEYVKQQTLYHVTKQVNKMLQASSISKRELARRLGTSLSQVSRLLDTTNEKKELSRLIEIAAILDYEFKWQFKKAA